MLTRFWVLSAVVLILEMPVAHAQCDGNDRGCWLRHNNERMEDQMNDQMREDMRDIDRDLDRMMEKNRRSNSQQVPPAPPPSCDQITSFGSFVRGGQAGGILGAFANIEEERLRCEAEAANAKQPTKSDFNEQHEARVKTAIMELEKQAAYDKQLAIKTCAYHRSLMGQSSSDLASVIACINLGYIK